MAPAIGNRRWNLSNLAYVNRKRIVKRIVRAWGEFARIKSHGGNLGEGTEVTLKKGF